MSRANHEGVIKFQLDFQPGPIPDAEALVELNLWREKFRTLGLLGQDPARYQGYGFGNLSRRFAAKGNNAFLISGTQTGGLDRLLPEHYATVLSCNPDTNRIAACGQTRPSSEALSHGVLYQCCAGVNWVMHLHSNEIFNNRDRLGLPCTAPSAAYGTPEMAAEIRRLAAAGEQSAAALLVMTGHLDGILAFGAEAAEVGALVVDTLRRATTPD